MPKRPLKPPHDQPDLFGHPTEPPSGRAPSGSRKPAPASLLEEVDDKIAALEAELSKLRKKRAGMISGSASAGRPRKRRFPDAEVLEAYRRILAEVGEYGARRRTAEHLKMSERHLGRILRGRDWPRRPRG